MISLFTYPSAEMKFIVAYEGPAAKQDRRLRERYPELRGHDRYTVEEDYAKDLVMPLKWDFDPKLARSSVGSS
jgi:hypothetical protein